jgi:ATP/maltotriose-dependent transcriptional regulator MalT
LISKAENAAKEIGDPEERLVVLSVGALVSRSIGDLESARQDCIDLADLGNATEDPWAEAWAHSALATIDLAAGDLEAAASEAQTAIDMFRELGDVRGVGWGLVSMAHAAFGKNDLDRADRFARDALAASTTTMDYRSTSWILELLAEIALERENAERAAVLWGAAHPLLRQRGMTSSASKRHDLESVGAKLEADLGDAFPELCAVGSSNPDSVVSEELAISQTNPVTG